MNKQLPPHLSALLGKGVARADLDRVIAMLEVYGVRVEVRRVQLGSMRAEGFGKGKVVYRTPETEQEAQLES